MKWQNKVAGRKKKKRLLVGYVCGLNKRKSMLQVRADSFHCTHQVSLTSLNTLLRLSGGLHSTLLSLDFSRLSLRHGAAGDYHILKKILH